MVQIYVYRNATECNPLVNILQTVRQELAAQFAAAEGIEAEPEGSMASFHYRIEGAAAQITRLLDKLYALGQTGFRVDVETDEEAQALERHPAIGKMFRDDIRIGGVLRLSP